MKTRLFAALILASITPHAAAEAPHRDLDAMDTRKPVPLLPMMALHQRANMRDHLEAVQALIAALAAGDHAAMERAGQRLGTTPQMTQMCHHMGAGAPGFTDMALAFHRKADGIAEAARRKDAKAVLKALDATLAACTGCHATYKQQVVDAAEWTRLTGGAPPAHGH